MKATYLLFVWLLSVTTPIAGFFKTLDDIVAYAQQAEEYPDIDNTDWQNPDYSSFYKKKQHMFGGSKWTSWFTRKHNVFDVKKCRELLKKLTIARKKRAKTNAIRYIVAEEQSAFVIFGDLRGAFHSLVRSLQKLLSLGLITNDLHIAENVYVVFNGNVINASAYNLETLSVVLFLTYKNPDRVCYIAGDNESIDNKATHELYNQLKVLAGKDADDIFRDMQDFFSTLDDMLYVAGSKEGMLQIFSKNSAKDKMPQSDNTAFNVPIKAIITSHDNSQTLGLKRYMGPPTTWRLFSSPIGLYRRLYGFTFDAFAVIHAAVHFNDWFLSFYAHDVRSKGDFDIEAMYSLLTGTFISGSRVDFFDTQEIEQFEKAIKVKKQELEDLKLACKENEPQDHSEAPEDSKMSVQHESLKQENGMKALHDGFLLIGSTGDVSEGLKSTVEALRYGMDMKAREINAQGGINGIQLKFAYADDGGDPENAKSNINVLMEQGPTDLFMACVGTPTLESYINLVQEGKITVFFPLAGAQALRTSHLEHLLFYSPSNEKISIAVGDYISKHYASKRWALLYEDDPFGVLPKNAVKGLLSKRTGTQLLEVPFSKTDAAFSQQMKAIVDFDPDVIGFFGTVTAVQGFVATAGVRVLANKIMFGLPQLAGNKLQFFLREKGLKIITPCVVPNPLSDIPLIKKFRQNFDHNIAMIDPNTLEGYINVALFGHLLAHIQAPISAEKIMQAAQAMKDLNFEGLQLSFDETTRVLSHSIWLDLGDGKDWVHIDVQENS